MMLHRGPCAWPREQRQCTFVFNFAHVGHSESELEQPHLAFRALPQGRRLRQQLRVPDR